MKEQFAYEDFCIKFARFLYPMLGADEVIVKSEIVTKLYRRCTRLYMAPAEAGISKADISFRIGCEYLESFTLYGQTFKKDATKDFASPFYCTGNLNVVVRKDIKSGEYEVKKNMNEFFHANVLYLMRYTGHYQMTREKLKQFRKDLYKEKIYLVFYDEINRAKDVLDDFGVLL